MGKELLNLITQDEQKAMLSYIDNYALNDERRTASFEDLFEPWAYAKENLYKIFGNKLKVEKEVSYSKPDDQLEEDFRKAMRADDSVMAPFIRRLDSFLWANRVDLGKDYYRVKDLLNIKYLYNNKFSGTPFEVFDKDGHKIQAQVGCKPVKILGKITDAYGALKDEFENFRLEHSRLLNQKLLKGHLVLSIHPLDFMTMSDNGCGWSSCMSWVESGCYRQGTVEMMNSPMVAVAYLTSKEDWELPSTRLPWSNKKWRILTIIDKNVIATVKGYPYQSQALNDGVINFVRDLCKAYDGAEYMEPAEYFGNSSDNRKAHCGNGNYNWFKFETNYMYNDFGTATHKIAVSKALQDTNGKTFHIYYSGESECMACSATDISIDGEGCLVCDDCYEKSYCRCDNCDERIYDGEEYYVDDQTLCPYCYDDLTAEDDITGDVHLNDNIDNIYIIPDELKTEIEQHPQIVIRESMYHFTVYQGAVGSRSWKRKVNTDDTHTTSQVGYGVHHYVFISELTDEGKRYFNINDADTASFISAVHRKVKIETCPVETKIVPAIDEGTIGLRIADDTHTIKVDTTGSPYIYTYVGGTIDTGATSIKVEPSIIASDGHHTVGYADTTTSWVPTPIDVETK